MGFTYCNKQMHVQNRVIYNFRFHILRGITEGTETYTRLGTHVQSAVWAPSGTFEVLAIPVRKTWEFKNLILVIRI